MSLLTSSICACFVPSHVAESVLAVVGRLDADPKLEGKGLGAAFARSSPDLLAEAEGNALAATEAARVAMVLGGANLQTRGIQYSFAESGHWIASRHSLETRRISSIFPRIYESMTLHELAILCSSEHLLHLLLVEFAVQRIR
eukprot:COSAG02_NODE_21_length_53083_cov_95.733618_26_plen_143_part_00